MPETLFYGLFYLKFEESPLVNGSEIGYFKNIFFSILKVTVTCHFSVFGLLSPSSACFTKFPDSPRSMDSRFQARLPSGCSVAIAATIVVASRFQMRNQLNNKPGKMKPSCSLVALVGVAVVFGSSVGTLLGSGV